MERDKPVEQEGQNMTPVPIDSPLMQAWESFQCTRSYANLKKWAAHPEHVDGSLWAAFARGWMDRAPAEPAPVPGIVATGGPQQTGYSVASAPESPAAEGYPGQNYFHTHNANIRNSELRTQPPVPAPPTPTQEDVAELATEIAEIYWPVGTTSEQDAFYDEQLEKVKVILIKLHAKAERKGRLDLCHEIQHVINQFGDASGYVSVSKIEAALKEQK